jgi:putative PIN family toxin of toxin-antitoxin system
MQKIVLDTNVVLDLFVFDDQAARELNAGLQAGRFEWLATASMRDELERVLAYPQIAGRLAFYELSADAVLAQFDRHACMVDVAAKAPVTCKDGDDQKFIDLAVAHRATLLSKDAAVLTMRKRLAALDVGVAAALAS